MSSDGNSKFAEQAGQAKTKMIVGMAIDFAGMTRVFAEGSNTKIFLKLEELLADLDRVSSRQEYDDLHAKFCAWFTQNIRTAEKTLKNGAIKPEGPASYGQAAKVLDISAKVFVHYSGLPSAEKASGLLPILHGAIDTQILKHLKKRFRKSGVRATTIEEINCSEYQLLQSLIGNEIQEDFKAEICPVQYDDILFLQLNRAPVN